MREASSWLRDEDEKGPTTEALEDPDLLSGVVDAPLGLQWRWQT